MSDQNEILQEETKIELPTHYTLKIEPYQLSSSKAQEEKCVSEILREERDLQPAHFTLKIESYSSLLDALTGKGEKYESGIFNAGGYKWKLILYPFGNKTSEGKDYISLHLAIDESNSFPSDNWTICVSLKLFVLNQKTMKYLTIQDAKGAAKYFDKLRTEQGCAQLLSVNEFNDPRNGYLVNDCCMFGAEVLVIQPSSGSEETLTMIKELDERTYAWSIENFSTLENVKFSDEFTIGGRKWKLQVFPKGHKNRKDKSLALYLWLQDYESVVPKRKVFAKYKLRVLDHSQVKTVEKSVAPHWFDAKAGHGYPNFMPLNDINEPSNGYLKDDTLTVEVEFDVISAIKCRP